MKCTIKVEPSSTGTLLSKIPTTAEEKNLPFGSSAQNGSIQYYEQGHKLELVLDELHAKRIFSRH